VFLDFIAHVWALQILVVDSVSGSEHAHVQYVGSSIVMLCTIVCGHYCLSATCVAVIGENTTKLCIHV
jgi:hypothetical protein